MKKKFPYQRGTKNEMEIREHFFNKLSFLDNNMLLDDFPLLGVTDFTLKKSSTGMAELQLKMLVNVKGLDSRL
ncbi:hypothetical protein IHP33_12015 [Enterococcus faecalis]|uniref:hypothetical protein n=1 Tax=Enterococcus faecalis TaxID=1351 RepID=UPI0017861B33|nr:hypothetical protein [Enterococcus faecalis]MBD9846445.1 hypothetical protein [Enterococcus faecalis]